jgi:S1-C subfamily serine protease
MNTEKIPASVTFIASDQLREFAFMSRQDERDVNIKVGEAIISAYVRQLSEIFESVEVAESPRRARSTDLVAHLSAEWTSAGYSTYFFTSQLSLYDGETKIRISKYEDQRHIKYSAPAAVWGLAALTVASVFILSPITTPLTTQAIGSETETLLKDVVDGSAKAIRYAIENDYEVERYIEASRRGSSRLAAPHERTQAASPLDHLLNSVFVIRAGDFIGSAFCVSSHMLLTNEHVIAGSAFVEVRRRDGRIHRGRVVSTMDRNDLALVKLEEASCTPLPLARSEEVVVGREVWAIGTPQGLSWSVSKGIVSAVRDLKSARLIQTDAAVNSGNSGGPLIDRETGKVIGVNTMMLRGGSAQGLNFAVSSEDALAAFPTLRDGGV